MHRANTHKAKSAPRNQKGYATRPEGRRPERLHNMAKILVSMLETAKYLAYLRRGREETEKTRKDSRQPSDKAKAAKDNLSQEKISQMHNFYTDKIGLRRSLRSKSVMKKNK